MMAHRREGACPSSLSHPTREVHCPHSLSLPTLLSASTELNQGLKFSFAYILAYCLPQTFQSPVRAALVPAVSSAPVRVGSWINASPPGVPVLGLLGAAAGGMEQALMAWPCTERAAPRDSSTVI